MMMNDYVALKIRDLENERLNHTHIAAKMQETSGSHAERSKAKPVIGPALRVAGRTLRRVGEGLEGWATPSSSDGDGRFATRRPPG